MQAKREESHAMTKIDIKSMDDMLKKHVDRVLCDMEKNKKTNEKEMYKVREKIQEEWEIDPAKLVTNKEAFARGTFGSVHKGRYMGAEVAVKLLDWGEDKRGILQRYFHREVSVWYNLDHPNITKCVGAATTMVGSSACVVAEYVPGGTLKSYLKKFHKRKLEFNVVLQLALDLAKGLNYLHSKKIVHRDIKSENLLLDKNGRVKIADFGVSRLEAAIASEMTGNTGTQKYMAPEVLECKPYDKKCDVYSFGICLWEIYCCKLPYADCSNYSVTELTSAIVKKNFRPQIPRSCPSSLVKIIKRCWDADPSRRPEMEEVIKMLEGSSKPHHGWFCFSMPETK